MKTQEMKTQEKKTSYFNRIFHNYIQNQTYTTSKLTSSAS